MGGGSSRQGPSSNIVNISRNSVDSSINFMSRIPIIDQFSPSPMFQFRRPRCGSSGRRAWCWWWAAGWSWPAGAGAAGRTQPSPGGLTTRTSKVSCVPSSTPIIEAVCRNILRCLLSIRINNQLVAKFKHLKNVHFSNFKMQFIIVFLILLLHQ